MGRADDLRAMQAAELAMVELEERLLAAKETGDEAALRDIKPQLREARRAFRELREGGPVVVEDGDAVIRPATVKTSAAVGEVG